MRFKKYFLVPLLAFLFTSFTTVFADKDDDVTLTKAPPYISFDEHEAPVMHFAVINLSTRIHKDFLKKTIDAVEQQVETNFAPTTELLLNLNFIRIQKK